jgi:zinc transporter ZupT
LLVYLALGTWLDANEFAQTLPVFWQGVPLVVFISLIALGVLLAVGSVRKGVESTPLSISYRIAMGIGLHNLGEGLAIGAAFALGQAALGTFLILGFTLHNITEGVGIAAPIVRQNPGLKHFALLILVSGGPAILGTWLGGFAFDPVLATIFLAVGVGAILQVVWEVGKLVAKDTVRLGKPVINWVTLGGLVTGIAIMYFTAFLVKF